MSEIAVISEPLTYEREAPRSYFKDLVAAERSGDIAAQNRLMRHAAELEVELKRREQARRTPEGVDFERRADPSPTQGQGGYFAPPLWLIDAFATAPRPGRVLAAKTPTFLLPRGVQSINLPRLTAGTDVEPTPPLSAAGNQDITDAPAGSQVVTLAGEGDVALQLLEQSPAGAHLDWAIFKDLSESYDAKLETQMIAGTGTSQILGITQVSSINAITFTSASPAASGMFAPFGQAVAQIGDNRLLPPETWLMRTARWAWLASSPDGAGRPLVLANHDGPLPYVGDLLAFPVNLDDAVPVVTGRDEVIACRPSDLMLFESEPRTAVHLDVLSGTMQARLQLIGFAAAITGRYPSGISVVSGTGMAVPSGF